MKQCVKLIKLGKITILPAIKVCVKMIQGGGIPANPPPPVTMAQSHPDLNLTETLWQELKRTIHKRMPANPNN